MEWIKFTDRRPPIIGGRTIIRLSDDFEFLKKGRVIGPNKNIWKRTSVEYHGFHSGKGEEYTTVPYDVLEWLDEGVASTTIVPNVKSETGADIYLTRYNNGDTRFHTEDGSKIPDMSYEAGKEEFATTEIDNDFTKTFKTTT